MKKNRTTLQICRVFYINFLHSPPPNNGPSHFGENTEHANFGDNIYYIMYMAYRSVQGIHLHNLYMIIMIKRGKINTYPRIHFNTCLRWLSPGYLRKILHYPRESEPVEVTCSSYSHIPGRQAWSTHGYLGV